MRTEDGKLLPGMPSGHVMITQSLLTFFALEALKTWPKFMKQVQDTYGIEMI